MIATDSPGGCALDCPPPDFSLQGLYQVDSVLGSGGGGETWLALDPQTQQRVAIKFVRRCARRRGPGEHSRASGVAAGAPRL